MRVVHIIAQNWDMADAMIQLLNNHSHRNRMRLVPCVGIKSVMAHEIREAVIVTPYLDDDLSAIKERIASRGGRCGECEVFGGYVLGELL